MKKIILLLFLLCSIVSESMAQPNNDQLPVRGFCIGAPTPAQVDEFVSFIAEELAPRQVNTLILRIDYNFEYQSHPELRSSNPLKMEDVKKMVKVSREHGIRIIPQINLLGHQSWHGTASKLLQVYPEFDETPWVQLPEKYEWPNADGLYCKSYCPLHPEVHQIVFSLVDEICDAFETNAFHAGMDEVFYLAEEKCPRCGGRNPAELFAGELTRIRNHLALKNRELWIWGDRLIDGKTTGMGIWEASFNNTHQAIDLIPKDVVICDWHYERPDQTPVYFAMKGFRVITCPWRKPEVAVQQVRDMYRFRETATPELKERYLGMMQTVWSGAGDFMEGIQGMKPDARGGEETAWHCFKSMYKEINKQE
jgi:hypothetical protein